MVTAPILPTLLRLSAPNVAAMLAQALVAIAETAIAGLLGTPALAGFALVFPFAMLQQMMSAGAMGGGISSAVSRALGAGDRERATSLAIHALAIGATAGLATSVIMLSLGPTFYRTLGGQGSALAEASRYAAVLFIGAPSIWLCNTLASILRGTGDMRLPSSILLAASIVQAVLGGILALGLGPIPRFGMAGLAAGQTIAFTGAAFVMFAILFSGRANLKPTLRTAQFDRAMFADILKVGAIAVISPIQSVLTVLILTRLVATFGTEAIAGYGIGARLEFLLVPLVFAVGVASVPMVGMAIGAGQVARARKVALSAALLAGGVTGAIGLLVALQPALWAQQFSINDGVLSAAGSYLRWVGPAFGFYGFGLALYFATQGSGRILGPVLAQTARLIVIAIGALWISAGANVSYDAMFALVAAAMIVYGIASAIALHVANWGPRP